jgi:membrane protease YdiL (CAAX protease family)
MEATQVEKTTPSARLKVIIYAALIIIAAPFCAKWLARMLSQYTSYNLETYGIYWFIFSIIVYALLASIMIYAGLKLGMPIRCFPVKMKFSSRPELIETIKYSSLLIGVDAFLSVLPSLVPLRQHAASNLPILLISHAGWIGFIALVLATVFSPIFEEVVVRGIVLSRLLVVYQTRYAILVSTVLWVLAHPGNWILIFLIGILHSYVTIRLHSLLPAILGHVMINSMTAWMLIHGL